MPLCTACDSIDVGVGGIGATHPEVILGTFSEVLERGNDGCDGCQFFCSVLKSSISWKDRLEELNERVVIFSSLRLDVRKKDELDGRSWSCDDLLFDICVPQGYQGMLSTGLCTTERSAKVVLILDRS